MTEEREAEYIWILKQLLEQNQRLIELLEGLNEKINSKEEPKFKQREDGLVWFNPEPNDVPLDSSYIHPFDDISISGTFEPSRILPEGWHHVDRENQRAWKSNGKGWDEVPFKTFNSNK